MTPEQIDEFLRRAASIDESLQRIAKHFAAFDELMAMIRKEQENNIPHHPV